MTALEVVVPGRAALAEGPVWDEDGGTLLWVDIVRGELHRLGTAGDRVVARFDAPLAGVAIRRGGGLVCGVGMQLGTLDEGSGAFEPLVAADRGDRLNELKCDPQGRLWAGTLTDGHVPGASALYRLDGRGLETVLEDVALSNGIGWSPDGGTMYYVDTPRETVDAFDYDPGTGAATRRRTFADLRDVAGRPDGLTVDEQGGVWVAMARGWAVRRFLPDGTPDMVVDVDAFRVTSCTFGGADLGELYITTASFGQDERELEGQPHAGAVLRCRPGVRGLPASEYAG